MKIINAGWHLDNSYIRLPETFYSKQDPTPVPSPQLVILNEPLAASLGLDVNALQSSGAEIFAGNRIPEGAAPIAQAYAGHQFGHFTMLGDGRALLLGEQITPEGGRFDIQLKGSGRTPYSRGGDGRAALGPMLREYIISEALHNLNIPTTRSLAVATTGQEVIREKALPGAILTRIAASHIRVGTFQYAAAAGNVEDLQSLAEYALQRHFPTVASDEKRFLLLLKEVIKKQAELIAKWQLVGFIHGVMNTDNMTISGETIDFGPCAFMDTYSPGTVFSSIDMQGRYAYGNQPQIAAWNLARFAETLLPLLHDDENEAINMANEEIAGFAELYFGFWLDGMRAKLGLFDKEAEDELIITELLTIMEKYKADYTNTFRSLTIDSLTVDKPDGMDIFHSAEFSDWREKWDVRRAKENRPKEESNELMRRSNPAIIPRNHRVEEALLAAEKDGDFRIMEKLLSVLSCPYSYSIEQEEFSTPPPPSSRPYRTFCGT